MVTTCPVLGKYPCPIQGNQTVLSQAVTPVLSTRRGCPVWCTQNRTLDRTTDRTRATPSPWTERQIDRLPSRRNRYVGGRNNTERQKFLDKKWLYLKMCTSKSLYRHLSGQSCGSFVNWTPIYGLQSQFYCFQATRYCTNKVDLLYYKRHLDPITTHVRFTYCWTWGCFFWGYQIHRKSITPGSSGYRNKYWQLLLLRLTALCVM